jgi:hypothetical protein
VGAWYWGQALHEVILARFARVLEAHPASGIRLLQWLYGAMLFAGWMCWIPALRLTCVGSRSTWAVAIGVVSPLSVWLAFKLMAESPAFLFASVSALALARASRVNGGRCEAWALLSGASLALSFGTMVYMPLLTLGFAVSLYATRTLDQRRAVRALALAAFAGSATAWIIFSALGLAPGDYFRMYEFYRAYEKSWLVNLFGVLTGGSLLWAAVPLAFANRDRRAARRLLLWVVVALLPVMVLSSNYFEARFVIVVAPPLVCLFVLAVERLSSGRRMLATQVAALSGVAALSFVSLPFLPYEMSSREIDGIIDDYIEERDAVVLVPWNYTDFHYLRLRYPDRSVLLVQSPVDEEGAVVDDAAWERRMGQIYGGLFISDLQGLEGFAHRPLYYLGHGRMPPFENLARLGRSIGLPVVSAQIDRMNPLEHVTHSWMWNHPAVKLTPIVQGGHYRLFSVHLSATSEAQ